MRQLTLLQKPTSEIITLAEAKNYMRIDHDLDDNLILSLIQSMREAIESIIQKSIMKQTWEYAFIESSVHEFDFGACHYPAIYYNIMRIPLPKPPIMGIISVVINNKKIEVSKYSLEIIDDKFCLCINDRRFFSNKRKISIIITYTAGIANCVENVPYQLKLANTMLVANAYQERFSYMQSGISQGVRQLLSPFLDFRI